VVGVGVTDGVGVGVGHVNSQSKQSVPVMSSGVTVATVPDVPS
jgi:hypothetical protein